MRYEDLLINRILLVIRVFQYPNLIWDFQSVSEYYLSFHVLLLWSLYKPVHLSLIPSIFILIV